MSLWADAGGTRGFSEFRKGASHLDAVERVKDWTRIRFALSDDDTVLLSEVDGSLPGCPPLETLIAFWTVDGTRHHFKVFKPAEEVLESDLPPGWMKQALAAIQGIECSCC